MQKRPLVPTGNRFGMCLDGLGMFHHELLEVLDQHPLPCEQGFHRPRPAEREMALERHPVKTGNDTGDIFVEPIEELFHGVLPQMAV